MDVVMFTSLGAHGSGAPRGRVVLEELSEVLAGREVVVRGPARPVLATAAALVEELAAEPLGEG